MDDIEKVFWSNTEKAGKGAILPGFLFYALLHILKTTPHN